MCGISTQLSEEVVGFDELISLEDPDFGSSSLNATSLLRLSWLVISSERDIGGTLGAISTERLQRLRNTLADHIATGSVAKPRDKGQEE